MTNTPIQSSSEQAGQARQAVVRLQDAGFVAYWAGGCVRDRLLNRTPVDYDIATDARPDDVVGLFPGAVEVGKAFGVVRAPLDDAIFDIATFRIDHDYKDGRHPESVSFADAQSDAHRRDFTINAIFYDPVAESYHDYVNGRRDIHDRIVRCVGNPRVRFQQDHLRMLRAARFAGTLEFTLDPDTEAAIRAEAAQIGNVSPERIRDELTRILLESPRAGDALVLLDRIGLLHEILPEVEALKGQEQPDAFHPEGDVFEHTVKLLNLMTQRDKQLAFAALFHDIGKPPTAQYRDGRVRFDKHAAVGAAMARARLKELRFPNDDIEAITRCVHDHMRFIDVPNMKRSTLRTFAGAETFPVELELHRLDCLASHGMLDNYELLTAFSRELADEPVLPEPWITGRDILALGVPEGPEIGKWHRRAYEAQLDERFAAREPLMEWLKGAIATGPA